jgi:mono/diheme cytochrome c family protein
MRRINSLALAVVALSLPLQNASLAGEQTGIPPETVADYLHAVIETDRTFYTIHVVERLQKDGGPTAAEDWRAKKNTLPLPAQFLMETSELAAKTGSQIRYRLISLWPINPLNAPKSESEQSGLEALRVHPDRTVTGTVTHGKETYFQAIYADRAVSQSCIGCHNAHPRSPKKDFKMNEAMGGLVIEIPIGR